MFDYTYVEPVGAPVEAPAAVKAVDKGKRGKTAAGPVVEKEAKSETVKGEPVAPEVKPETEEVSD